MLDRSFIIKSLRAFLPRPTIDYIKNEVLYPLQSYFFRFTFKKKMKQIHAEWGNAVLLMATPTHGNLGDQAIVLAERELLKDIGLKNRIVEIPNQAYHRNKEFVRKEISKSDILIIDGGGNLGTLWPREDDKISEIINDYYMNPIVVFPQTCYYANTKKGEERICRNNHIYTHAKNLLITLRDLDSYNFCRNNFAGSHFLNIPDIVLYLNKLNMHAEAERQGILFCFRQDLEKVVSQDDITYLKQVVTSKDIAYRNTSTIVHYSINSSRREKELMKKWNEFSTAKLIITDRLHGMIFAVITGTPCLAIDNISKKVSGVYNLVSGMKNVKICDNMGDVIESLDHFYNLGNYSPSQSVSLEAVYSDLKNLIISYK